MDKIYACDEYCELEFEGLSHDEAAEAFASSGDWGDRLSTDWLEVFTYRYDEDGERIDSQSHTIKLEAIEPPCPEGDAHDWQSPHAIVGGQKDDPGVRPHGGGVLITEVCMRCGCRQVTNTWARSPDREGVTKTTYTPGYYADQIAEDADEDEDE